MLMRLTRTLAPQAFSRPSSAFAPAIVHSRRSPSAFSTTPSQAFPKHTEASQDTYSKTRAQEGVGKEHGKNHDGSSAPHPQDQQAQHNPALESSGGYGGDLGSDATNKSNTAKSHTSSAPSSGQGGSRAFSTSSRCAVEAYQDKYSEERAQRGVGKEHGKEHDGSDAPHPQELQRRQDPSFEMNGGYGGDIGSSTAQPSVKSMAGLRLMPTSSRRFADSSSPGLDPFSDKDARGVTGGGKPLASSSKNAPSPPKVSNASVPGGSDGPKLSEDQQKEVDEHNAGFEKDYERAHQAAPDKVDDKYWKTGKRE